MSTVSGKAFDLGLFNRVMAFVKPYRSIFWVATLLTILLSALGVLRPVLVGDMIDRYTATGDKQGLLTLTLVIVGILILEAVVQFYQTYLTSWLGQSVTIDLRAKLFKHILSFKLRYFDRTAIGTLVTRVISDIETIAEIFAQGLLTIIGDLLKLIVVVAVMFWVDWRLALLVLIPIPILLIATNIFKNAIKKAFQDVRTQVSRLNAFVQEHITGMHVVQVFGREEHEYQKFQEINKGHRNAHIASVWAYSIFFPVVEILSATSLALLVWYGMRNVLDNVVSFGDLVTFILLIYMMFRPIRQLADRFNVLQMGMVGSDRVFKVLDRTDHIARNGSHAPKKIAGDIVFQDVHFAYDDKNFVLHDINLEVKRGETVAFVGATGAGKSSIVNLLSRFYEFDQGSITIDGRDIHEFDVDSLRANIAVVMQDVFLFSDTILNNITLNDPSISREEVIKAAKAIGVHNMIMKFPDGYDHNVRERGGMLSTGQRQLISFIRAYVTNPSILVLDEATSSVDTETEELIQNAIERLTEGRTSIVIAHRLSTVQNADKIIVLSKGKVLEQGSHFELLDQGGHYKRLFDLQFS